MTVPNGKQVPWQCYEKKDHILTSEQKIWPTQVLLPSDYEDACHPRPDVQALAEDVVLKLCAWLGIEVTRISINSIWKTTRPEGTKESFFDEFSKVLQFP
jgi:hypothetical protein